MADKGLKSNVVGLFGGTLLGISSVAPAYVLTATLGILAVSVGEKTPVVIIAGFLPMFFAAYAYREFNTDHAGQRHFLHLDHRRRSAPTSAGSAGGPRWSPRSSCCPISPESRFSSCISSSAALVELGDDQRSVGEQADQRDHLPGVPGDRDLRRLPRHRHHRAACRWCW